jgi:ABC-2 type transport system ATP-binding protein
MEEADALCERLAVIDHGKVLALGTPAELKAGLGADTVITLSFAESPDALLPRIEKLAAVDHVEAADGTVRVYAADAAGLLADIVSLATKAKLRVTDASSQPPTLEAVFLALTGRDLRE